MPDPLSMTDPAKVAEIASKLTKAQRETLLDNRRCVASYKPAHKLVELGLWTGAGDKYTLYSEPTPLGLAVRSHLESIR